MSRRVVLISAVSAIALAGGAVAWSVSTNAEETTVDAAPSLTTATIEQRDVVTYDETSATLGYTDSVTVSSPAAGTVTSVVATGDQLTAGSIVATVDGSPVVAMIGDVPGWRDLSTSSTDGIDVRQLETNLVALGFDPDGAIAIDEEYDTATQTAVNLWKAALGLDEDGEVAQGLVTFVPGELQVDNAATEVGGSVSDGGALLDARMTRRTVPIVAHAGATIGSVATPDTPVTTGTILYRNAGLPVAAIEGDSSSMPVLDRSLEVGVTAGNDIRLFEQMLSAGGFTADGALVVDDTFDDATAVAVLGWWQSIDPAITVDPAEVVVPAGSFVVVPGGLQVGDSAITDGTTLAADGVVATLTAPARVVTTTAPVGDDTFAVGAPIDVEFPDGTISTGTVVAVGTVATNPSGTPGETPTVDISIRVDDIPSSVDSFVSIPVTLRVIDTEVDDALVVPTSALVALAEGGYALEIVTAPATATTPASTTLVAVEPSLYSDGFVVVTGDGLTEGTEIVVPS